ncbi:MAG: hypothetical protein WAK50_10695 [Nitrososphaeraceae archaeon]|jgi:hypothetical protein
MQQLFTDLGIILLYFIRLYCEKCLQDGGNFEWSAKVFVKGIKLKNQLETREGMQPVRSDAKYARFLLIGKGSGVPAVGID